MYRDMCRVLPHYGFERYEIANFARHGKRSRHNQKYWRYHPYIGVGAAATSFVGSCRRTNVPNWKEYVAGVGCSDQWYQTEILTEYQQVEEYVFMHLRMRTGVDLAKFSDRFQCPFSRYYSDSLTDVLRADGLIVREGDVIHLTEKGMALANQVMSRFILT